MIADERKIVHVITGLNDGGAEAVLFRLCSRSLSAKHVVVSLMDEGKYGQLLRQIGVKVYCLRMKPGKLGLAPLWRLARIMRLEEPTAVQTWMYHSDLLGGLAAKAVGVKDVFWGIHHSVLEKGKAKRSTIAIARICAMLSSTIPKKIICCANRSLEVHKDIGYCSKKLVVIPNGYDLSVFKEDAGSGLSIRSEFSVSSDTFLIGKVGRYDPFKDHKNLLCALSEINSSGIEFKCLLVGSGIVSENKELATLIEKLGLSDLVILASQRTDIPAIMNALDLHVLSSSSEGFPNVLAEAMACGTPAVSTDVGDAGEIVGDLQLICPPGDARALSQLILLMRNEWAENPEAWAERKNKCIHHIQTNFSVERMVSSYEASWFVD